jgi:hypothetical protein
MEVLAGIYWYAYSPLEDETSISLVTILHGEFDNPLRIDIKHTSLVPPGDVQSTRFI